MSFVKAGALTVLVFLGNLSRGTQLFNLTSTYMLLTVNRSALSTLQTSVGANEASAVGLGVAVQSKVT